jgi:ubiquinone/menaquinone biosynthesis C-methylase UbiE
MSSSEELQKKLAVDVHYEQSALFSERYEEIKKNPYQNCFVYSRKRLNGWLDRFLPERGDDKKMLDVGCGTGYHLARYHERGFDISGVDGSEDMLKQAQLINPDIEFKQSDVDNLPYPDQSFDYVLCIEVLRYLPDIKPCVREIYRVLKPGGVALITAAPLFQANMYYPVNRIAASVKFNKLTSLKQFFHTSGELQIDFEKTGFTDTGIHGVFGGPWIWVEKIAPSVMPKLLKSWESVDDKLADAPFFRHLSNMFLIHAKK